MLLHIENNFVELSTEIKAKTRSVLGHFCVGIVLVGTQI